MAVTAITAVTAATAVTPVMAVTPEEVPCMAAAEVSAVSLCASAVAAADAGAEVALEGDVDASARWVADVLADRVVIGGGDPLPRCFAPRGCPSVRSGPCLGVVWVECVLELAGAASSQGPVCKECGRTNPQAFRKQWPREGRSDP